MIACDDDPEGDGNGSVDMSADAGTDGGQVDSRLDAQLGDGLDGQDGMGPTCSGTEHACPSGCCTWNPTLVSTDEVSTDLSLAVGPDGPVVAFRANDEVQIARGGGGAWTIESVSTPQPAIQISQVMLDDAGYPRLSLVRYWDEAAELPPYWRYQVYYLEESASGWMESAVAHDYSMALTWMALSPDGAPVVSVFGRDSANASNILSAYIGTHDPDGAPGDLSWGYSRAPGWRAGYGTDLRNEYDMAIATDGSSHHVMMASTWGYWTDGMINFEFLPTNARSAAVDADDESGVHLLIHDSDDVLRHYVRLGYDPWSTDDLVELENDYTYSVRISAHTADEVAYCYSQTDWVTWTLWAGFRTADEWFHLPVTESAERLVCDVAHDADGNVHMVVYDGAQGELVHGLMGQ